VVDAMPFVPDDNSQLAERCSDVFGIQAAGLAKRLECMGDNPQMVIGVSGGLDSTLALLIATRTCDALDLPRTNITAVTMPGFGTTDHTLTNARQLMAHLGVTAKEIDIREAALLEYHELAELNGYQPFGSITLDNSHPGKRMSMDDFNAAIASIPSSSREDLVFENVQARRRTEILMNMGFVLGTGDMSEMWLGWCTYNADHPTSIALYRKPWCVFWLNTLLRPNSKAPFERRCYRLRQLKFPPSFCHRLKVGNSLKALRRLLARTSYMISSCLIWRATDSVRPRCSFWQSGQRAGQENILAKN